MPLSRRGACVSIDVCLEMAKWVDVVNVRGKSTKKRGTSYIFSSPCYQRSINFWNKLLTDCVHAVAFSVVINHKTVCNVI